MHPLYIINQRISGNAMQTLSVFTLNCVRIYMQHYHYTIIVHHFNIWRALQLDLNNGYSKASCKTKYLGYFAPWKPQKYRKLLRWVKVLIYIIQVMFYWPHTCAVFRCCFWLRCLNSVAVTCTKTAMSRKSDVCKHFHLTICSKDM